MATELPYFTITNPEQCEWTPGFAKDADELATGLIGKIGDDGSIDLAGASDRRSDVGIVFTNRTLVYTPTDAYADDDEPVTLVRGANVKFIASAEFFSGATLPTPNDDLYLAASGKLSTTGSIAVGRVFGPADTIRSVPNTTKSVVRGELSLVTV